MKHPPSALIHTFLIASLIVCISACSSKEATLDGSANTTLVKVNSLLILPADVPLEKSEDDNGDVQDFKDLAEGAENLSDILEEIAVNRENIIFLSHNQKESILGDFSGSGDEICRYLGRNTGTDAVLQSNMFRYEKRVGGKYSVSRPASVSFSYRLIHCTTGRILCQGRFDETQKPLFSDLFAFFKASSRGFKWITADELLREGAEEEFKNCSYLEQ